MPDRDATLDAFITPDTEADEPADADAELCEEEGLDPGAESGGEDVMEPVTELAETTFAWSPDGVACAACGAETQRRWRTDAGFVCHDCVDWERAPER